MLLFIRIRIRYAPTINFFYFHFSPSTCSSSFSSFSFSSTNQSNRDRQVDRDDHHVDDDVSEQEDVKQHIFMCPLLIFYLFARLYLILQFPNCSPKLSEATINEIISCLLLPSLFAYIFLLRSDFNYLLTATAYIQIIVVTFLTISIIF